MLAVGRQRIENFSHRMVHMTTGLSGGIGVTYRDLCGALTAGIMIIGALYGRSSLNKSDARCQALATTYRDRFAAELGSVICHELRAEKYGCLGREPCSVLVERAAHFLLEVLDGKS
jgi:C_GCAxxG_C_C family probable redox protein